MISIQKEHWYLEDLLIIFSLYFYGWADVSSRERYSGHGTLPAVVLKSITFRLFNESKITKKYNKLVTWSLVSVSTLDKMTFLN